MTKSELRALWLRLIDGHTISQEQAIQVVGLLEEIAGYMETGGSGLLRSRPYCELEGAEAEGNGCPHAPSAIGIFYAIRAAGPLVGA